MKRSWIGFLLLVLLLLASVLTARQMTAMHPSIEKDLLQAAECAMLGDWENTRRFFLQAEEAWQEQVHFRACLSDHTPVEEIDGAFLELKVYCAAQEDVAFAGSCCELARKVAAVGEAHELVWWNLL